MSLRPINVMSDRAESVAIRTEEQRRITHRVTSLWELSDVLSSREADGVPSTLDLLGHSTRGAKLLRLGETVVDMTRPKVAAFFDDLASSGELERLTIAAVRLLGCETAVEPAGQLTIRLLASTLGLPVYGTRKMVLKSHHCRQGFDPDFSMLLVESFSCRVHLGDSTNLSSFRVFGLAENNGLNKKEGDEVKKENEQKVTKKQRLLALVYTNAAVGVTIAATAVFALGRAKIPQYLGE